uniref:Disintegrin domain-containing protein n=1 Tax=Globodera pallida TaxID=36090 RepID=A0A183C578_GLOPA
MIRALENSSHCEKKEVHCACGPLHFDQIMNGMCCDSDTSCACCSKDPTILKLPTWVRTPRHGAECNQQMISEVDGQPAFCLWSEGWSASKCCDKNYQLVALDKRYSDFKINVTGAPFAVMHGFNRNHPLCDNLPRIYPNVCAFDWYWVPNRCLCTASVG